MTIKDRCNVFLRTHFWWSHHLRRLTTASSEQLCLKCFISIRVTSLTDSIGFLSLPKYKGITGSMDSYTITPTIAMLQAEAELTVNALTKTNQSTKLLLSFNHSSHKTNITWFKMNRSQTIAILTTRSNPHPNTLKTQIFRRMIDYWRSLNLIPLGMSYISNNFKHLQKANWRHFRLQF